MINVLAGLAIAIVVFAVSIGVGLVVLGKFGEAVGGTANDTIQTLMGDTNGLGALVTWVGAIIALVVGMLFIGALMGKKQY